MNRTYAILATLLISLAASMPIKAGFWSSLLGITDNIYVVIPGKLVRSAQLKPETLERVIKEHNVTTIINLRGPNPTHNWWHREKAVADSLGVEHIDLSFKAEKKPTSEHIEQLLAAFNNAPGTVLVHCRHGRDRTGLACALLLAEHTASLLSSEAHYSEEIIKEAFKELGLKYGHMSWIFPAMKASFKRWSALRAEHSVAHALDLYQQAHA